MCSRTTDGYYKIVYIVVNELVICMQDVYRMSIGTGAAATAAKSHGCRCHVNQ